MMSGSIAQNEKAFERNFSNVTAVCGWLLVMLKQHLELHLQLEVSTHNVIAFSVEREEERGKKNAAFRPPTEGARLEVETTIVLS